jgi:hypothetical protein
VGVLWHEAKLWVVIRQVYRRQNLSDNAQIKSAKHNTFTVSKISCKIFAHYVSAHERGHFQEREREYRNIYK